MPAWVRWVPTVLNVPDPTANGILSAASWNGSTGDRIAYADRNREEAIRADWSNGKVAMTGRSYAGTMPFAVATTGVAGLETIVPVAGISDWYSFLNQQGAQRYWPAEMLMSFLAYFCASRYNDPALTEEQRQAILDFHQYFSYEQMKTGFDYSDFWKEGNYTLKADGIRCQRTYSFTV